MGASLVGYLSFLVFGVALVLVDGQLIRSNGRTYLAEAYPNNRVADSVNRLVTVLFHFIVLGVVALLSIVEFDAGGAMQTSVARIGVLLLVLAAAHGITMYALAKLRTRQREQRLQDRLSTRAEERFEHEGPTYEVPGPPQLPAQNDGDKIHGSAT